MATQVDDTKTTASNASIILLNKTDSNQQYFNYALHKELEFIEVQKHLMFINEYDNVDDKDDVSDLQTYKNLRSKNITSRLFETYGQVITIDDFVPIVLEGNPVIVEHVGRDPEFSIAGIPFTYKNWTRRNIKITPELERRQVKKIIDDGKKYIEK